MKCAMQLLLTVHLVNSIFLDFFMLTLLSCATNARAQTSFLDGGGARFLP